MLARLEPGGIVAAYWDLKYTDKSEVTWPYALIGFRDARGRAYIVWEDSAGGGCADRPTDPNVEQAKGVTDDDHLSSR